MGLEAVACFQLKSERRKIRLRREDQEKRLLKLNREQDQLCEQIRNLGYEPLIPPIQKGWRRIFVLREDVKRSEKAAFFERLLEKINTSHYSDSKKFTVRKRRRGRKYYVAKPQKLRSFSQDEWQKKPLTDAEARCFTPTLIRINKKYELVYEFSEPWRYVLKVIPNMITEIKVRDFLLERRVAEIGYYLERNNLRPRLHKLLYGRNAYRDRWEGWKNLRYLNPLANKPLREIVTNLD